MNSIMNMSMVVRTFFMNFMPIATTAIISMIATIRLYGCGTLYCWVVTEELRAANITSRKNNAEYILVLPTMQTKIITTAKV